MKEPVYVQMSHAGRKATSVKVTHHAPTKPQVVRIKVTHPVEQSPIVTSARIIRKPKTKKASTAQKSAR
jgi:hypothetical protein